MRSADQCLKAHDRRYHPARACLIGQSGLEALHGYPPFERLVRPSHWLAGTVDLRD